MRGLRLKIYREGTDTDAMFLDLFVDASIRAERPFDPALLAHLRSHDWADWFFRVVMVTHTRAEVVAMLADQIVWERFEKPAERPN